jgi:hypothetical protein
MLKQHFLYATLPERCKTGLLIAIRSDHCPRTKTKPVH